MWTEYGPTFCLACHKVMTTPEAECPRCGADQETVRAALMARMDAPPPRRGALRRREPPLPLNAVETVACPTCRVPVAAGAPSCSYCGHTMLTDLPIWTPDDVVARRYLLAGLGSMLLGLACLVSGLGVLFLLGMPLVLIGMVFAMTGFGHNPLGWSETFMLGFAVLLGMFAVIILFAMAFMAARG